MVLIVAVIITNWDLSPKDYFLTMPVEHIACGIVHLSAYLIWIFGVNRNIIDSTAKNMQRLYYVPLTNYRLVNLSKPSLLLVEVAFNY